jgi:putative transcriptional regulator
MATKVTAKRTPAKKTIAAQRKPARSSVGQRIIEGLEQAVAWTQGRTEGAQVTVVHVPQTDVREVRQQMGLSQSQFAAKFGFPLATLQNWEQGRARPDAPTRVLLAVISRHPEAVEDVLGRAS